jgi:hypothetical protein
MVQTTRFPSLLSGIACVVALASAPAARAGGFGLSVALPPAPANAAMHDAVLLVRPEGCHGPGATVSARAEGLVNGRRRSVPLRLALVSTDAEGVRTYILRRQWPMKGTWVLAFTGTSPITAPNEKSATISCKALLELGPNGSVPSAQSPDLEGSRNLRLRYFSTESDEIEAALRGLAAKATRHAALVRSGR